MFKRMLFALALMAVSAGLLSAQNLNQPDGQQNNLNNPSGFQGGSWTPTLKGSNTAGTPTYTIQSGTYEILGRQVSARFNVAASTTTGMVGALQIGGLPIAAVGLTASDVGTCQFSYTGGITNSAGYSGIAALITSTQSVATIYEVGSAKTAQVLNVTTVSGSPVQIIGDCIYHNP